MYGYPDVTDVVPMISRVSDLEFISPLGPTVGNVVSTYST
jgi:hypothetical protein